MLDSRPPIASALTAFGVDAIVIPPGGAEIQTTAIWLPPETVQVPVGQDHQRAELRRVIAIPAGDVPTVLRGTIITAAEAKGQAARDWKVDAAERADFDHYRAMVVPA